MIFFPYDRVYVLFQFTFCKFTIPSKCHFFCINMKVLNESQVIVLLLTK